MKIKSDLNCHGLIGFHEPWFKLQGYNSKEIGAKIIDSAIKNEIGLMGLISEQYEIPKGSEHDRFNFLYNNLKENLRYQTEKLDNKDIAFIVRRKTDDGIVRVLNGQMALCNEKGSEKRYLAIGSNQVPNNKGYQDTLIKGESEGLLQIMSHRHLSEKNTKYFDAVEGHDAQNIWPNLFEKVPMISQITKGKNYDAIKFAVDNAFPYISASNSHTPESIGKASIILNKLNLSSGENILSSLKEKIINNQFENAPGYEDILTGLKWMGQFVYGIKFYKNQ